MVLTDIALVICVSFGNAYFESTEADVCVFWYSFAMKGSVACIPTCDTPFNDGLSETSTPTVDRKFPFINIITLRIRQCLGRAPQFTKAVIKKGFPAYVLVLK